MLGGSTAAVVAFCAFNLLCEMCIRDSYDGVSCMGIAKIRGHLGLLGMEKTSRLRAAARSVFHAYETQMPSYLGKAHPRYAVIEHVTFS